MRGRINTSAIQTWYQRKHHRYSRRLFLPSLSQFCYEKQDVVSENDGMSVWCHLAFLKYHWRHTKTCHSAVTPTLETQRASFSLSFSELARSWNVDDDASSLCIFTGMNLCQGNLFICFKPPHLHLGLLNVSLLKHSYYCSDRAF